MIGERFSLGINQLTEEVIGAAIAVHRELGPGLLESVYEHCLAKERTLRGIPFEYQKTVPVIYKGETLNKEFYLDMLFEDVKRNCFPPSSWLTSAWGC